MTELPAAEGEVAALRLAILITCHNRRETTVAGLRGLVPALGAIPLLTASYFVVDDGSTDGTADAVRSEFPATYVVQGSGDLYWAGGMAAAYGEARRRHEHFDAYLLFNDDVRVDDCGVASALATYRRLNRVGPSVVVGVCTSPATGAYTYGGWLRTSRLKALGFTQVFGDGIDREADTFNGNFVLIPARLFEALGGLDSRYRHAYADLDFGLRARERGARVVVHHVPVGTCERGISLAEKAARLPVRAAYRTLITGPFGLMPFTRFACRHGVRGLFPIYFCHEFATRINSILAASLRAKRVGRFRPARPIGAGETPGP